MDICWDYMEVTEKKDDNPSNSTQEGAPAFSVLDAEVDKREEIMEYHVGVWMANPQRASWQSHSNY